MQVVVRFMECCRTSCVLFFLPFCVIKWQGRECEMGFLFGAAYKPLFPCTTHTFHDWTLMNHKVHSLIIFMANPFSAVFFKRETATPINQEARILDFVIGSLLRLNNSLARTFRVCLHTVCHVFYGAISKFLAHIYIYSYRPHPLIHFPHWRSVRYSPISHPYITRPRMLTLPCLSIATTAS